MSETPAENPNQVVQPGAETTEAPAQPAPASSTSEGDTFPVKLVKQLTGDKDWNVAKGVWQTVVHAETGEPNAEYVLLATVGGVDVPLASYNAGRLDTLVRAAQQSQQSSGS